MAGDRGGRARLAWLGVVVGAWLAAPCLDVAADSSPYHRLRYDDDFGYLADPSKSDDFFDPIKYVPLGGDPDTYLSLGGELRERYQFVEPHEFGLAATGKDDVFLHRLLLQADLHLDDVARVFVQLGSQFASGRDLVVPPPTDTDYLDLAQGFVDLSAASDSLGKLTLRGGRQEIALGVERHLAVRESSNVRRSYDGARLFWEGGGYRVDALWGQPVDLRRGVFDDPSDGSQELWGIYGTGPVPGAAPLHADLYYLGVRRDGAQFGGVTAKALRHTLGLRLFAAARGFDGDLELTYQVGSFGREAIRAWGVEGELGYRAEELPLRPRFSLRADVLSGDRDPHDARLGTYDPLFASPTYYTEASLVAGANLMDLHPSVSLALPHDVSLSLGWQVLWRQTTRDAFYFPTLAAIQGTVGGSPFSGSQPNARVIWQVDRHLSLHLAYVHFLIGPTLRKAGGSDVDFAMASVYYRY